MRGEFLLGLFVGLLVTILGMGIGAGFVVIASDPSLPACTEDEVLRGYGDFEDGRWAHYRCVHPERVPRCENLAKWVDMFKNRRSDLFLAAEGYDIACGPDR